MTRAVGDDDAMIKSLDEVASLFDQAQTTVFKLMATVCNPTTFSSHGIELTDVGLGAKILKRSKVYRHPSRA
jgi:hypothetical protein